MVPVDMKNPEIGAHVFTHGEDAQQVVIDMGRIRQGEILHDAGHRSLEPIAHEFRHLRIGRIRPESVKCRF